MKKKTYPESPLSDLTNEQLEDVMTDMGIAFTKENAQGIQSKLAKKQNRHFNRPRYKVILAAAAAIILIPTSVLGANKIWEITTQQDGFLTTLVLNKSNGNEQAYKLDFTYLPENLVEHEELKYWDATSHDGGFSSLLIRPEDSDRFETLYATDSKETTINGHKVYFVERTVRKGASDVVSYMFFENENLVLKTYFLGDLSKEVQKQILAGVTLTKATESEGTTIMPVFEDDEKFKLPRPAEKLAQNSKSIHSVGETFAATDALDTQLEITVSDPQISTHISEIALQDKDTFYQLEDLQKNSLITESGELLPYTGQIYESGDGKTTLDSLVKEVMIQPWYKEFSMMIKNTTDHALDDFYFSPTYRALPISKNNYLNYLTDDYSTYLSPSFAQEGPIYMDLHGEGKAYYDIGTLKAGESKTITVGFLSDEFPDKQEMIEFNLEGTMYNDTTQWVKIP